MKPGRFYAIVIVLIITAIIAKCAENPTNYGHGGRNLIAKDSIVRDDKISYDTMVHTQYEVLEIISKHKPGDSLQVYIQDGLFYIKY